MINMKCTKKGCEEEGTLTSRVTVGDVIMEANLCDTHFQKFMDGWEDKV